MHINNTTTSSLIGFDVARKSGFSTSRANLFPYKRELRAQAIQMSGMSVPYESSGIFEASVSSAPQEPVKFGKFQLIRIVYN